MIYGFTNYFSNGKWTHYVHTTEVKQGNAHAVCHALPSFALRIHGIYHIHPTDIPQDCNVDLHAIILDTCQLFYGSSRESLLSLKIV